MRNKINKENVLGKIVITVWIILLMFSAFGIITQAASTEAITPQENQYFELKATSIKKVDERKTSNNGTLGIQYRFQAD